MENKAKIDSALLQIPTPSGREDWLTVSMAYKAAGGTYEIWDHWCQRGKGYNQTENRISWDSFTVNGGITEKTLFKIAIENGWTSKETTAIQQIRPENPVETLIRKAEERQSEIIQYFTARGFTPATIKRFHIGYHPAFILASTKEPRAIIPYPGESYYTARRLSQAQDQDDKKYLYPKKTDAGGKRLFNAPALQHNVVFVVEGQLDAMSIEQCGYAAVGCNETKQLVDALQNGGQANAFIIIPDADETGERKSRKLLAALQEMQKTAKINPLPEKIHDANQFLSENEEGLKEWLKQRKEELEKTDPDLAYAADSAAYMLSDFEKHAQTKRDMIPTGFPKLDEKLDGGLYEGLYVVGALPSVGKTTFCCQIMDQIAENGKDVIIISIEMSKYELIAKSLSRLTAQIAVQENAKKRTRELLHSHFYEKMTEEDLETLRIAKKIYRKYAGNVYLKEYEIQPQVSLITDQIRKHIEIHGRRPIVLIDFLQIIAPEDIRATEKQNTDIALLKLKQAAKKYHIPIVLISSFNRENYANEVNEASYKESGAIEYTGDVLIGLQYKGTGQANFNMNEAKQKNPREIEAVILKQRNGEAGGIIEYNFHAKYNLFTESTNE